MWLFTRSEGTGDLIYRLVNDNPDDWTGNYVITSGKDTSLIALKSISTDQRIENSTSGASVAYANTGMTLDGEVLRNVPNTYVFALAKNGSYYTIKNETTGFWIGTQSTYLHNMGSYQADYSDWNVEYDLYNICMKVANVASTQYTYLVKGSNSYFVVNTGYTTNKTQFWKEEVEGVTYYATSPEGAHEHSYGPWTSNGNGTHSCTCSECGDVATENCTYNDVVTQPTVTEQGYTTHTCTVCGYSFVDSYVDPLGYTVSFSVPAGVTAPGSMNCQAGASITLPTAGAPEGYTFLGWVTEDVNNVTEMPTVLTGSYSATADITLKALYSHVETTVAGYELLTEAPADWTGSYVITYGNTADAKVLKGVSGTKKLEAASAGAVAAFADTGMTIDGNELSGVTDAYVFTVTANGDKFVMQNVQTRTYLANRGSYLYSYKTLTTTYCLWSFAMTDGAVDATNASSKTRPHLTFNTAKNYFMVNSTAENIFFWKMGGSSSTTTYTTVIG